MLLRRLLNLLIVETLDLHTSGQNFLLQKSCHFLQTHHPLPIRFRRQSLPKSQILLEVRCQTTRLRFLLRMIRRTLNLRNLLLSLLVQVRHRLDMMTLQRDECVQTTPQIRHRLPGRHILP